MTRLNEQNTSGQARKGLLDVVKGTVKEVAGAVTGDDSLATEEQLPQAQARQRKVANSAEAVARTEAALVGEELGQVRRESAEEGAAIGAQTAAAEDAAGSTAPGRGTATTPPGIRGAVPCGGLRPRRGERVRRAAEGLSGYAGVLINFPQTTEIP
ncbi:CsbD family protein [Rhodococcus opacus]|uniref:CsbD family protein n=1 Tax=Rhodococcus opacus TaxID=37919 RepID=UPI001F544490|nr:CsbD family protein [Rhodococcus opacus]